MAKVIQVTAMHLGVLALLDDGSVWAGLPADKWPEFDWQEVNLPPGVPPPAQCRQPPVLPPVTPLSDVLAHDEDSIGRADRISRRLSGRRIGGKN